MARRGRGRTQGRRLRHHEAPACRLLATGPHPAADHACAAVAVRARRAVHVLGRPEPAAGHQTPLAVLSFGGPPGSGSRTDPVPGGHRRVLQAELPSVAARGGRARCRLSGPIAGCSRIALSGMSMAQLKAAARTTVTATDGVALAVHAYTEIDSRRPTILAVHGYPDNHHVWDEVAATLSDRYNVVAFDVRGAGESAKPLNRSGYRFPQLVADIGAVIDSLGVDQVHLLAHDWGSIQCWAAVTDDSVMGKVASFTSVSGPHLSYAGRFLRSARGPRTLA